jgi:CBS domain containing-hemolysin-like protein
VDEYGGAVGILTFEDIVEEITGEIEDEYDVETQPWKQLSEETWLIQARMEVSLINERLRLELPEGEYETLGGFLLQQFGRIPESGDELFFDTPAAALKFSIRKANARTIETVLVEKMTTDRDNQA